MTAAADAMSSPSNRVSVDLGKKMAALNRQADDLLAVKAVTELTSLECERMGIANIQSSSLVAEPKIATPGRTAGRAPAATTAISVNPVGGETSSPFLRSLRSGGSTVASYEDDHRRQEFRDVANTLSSFTASLPVDRPLMSESPDWMARTRSTSFAAAHGPLFKPPVPPPSHAPTFGSPSLKNGELFPAPILMSLPRAASYSATFSSPAAADASANYAVDAAVHYAASLGHAPTAPPHVEAARAALRGCARTPSTSALKIAAEAPASGGEKERLALFDRVQRTSLPTPLPLSETPAGARVFGPSRHSRGGEDCRRRAAITDPSIAHRHRCGSDLFQRRRSDHVHARFSRAIARRWRIAVGCRQRHARDALVSSRLHEPIYAGVAVDRSVGDGFERSALCSGAEYD